MFKDVQQQQEQNKSHLTVNHTLTERTTSMAINHLLKMKISKFLVLRQK